MGSVHSFHGSGAGARARVPEGGARMAPHARGVGAASLPSNAVLPSTGGRQGRYALGDVARALGMSHFARRTIIAKLRVLARHQHMPLPLTPRVVSGMPITGPAAIHADSRWDAAEFDAWHDGRGPAGPAGVADPAPSPRLRDTMKAAALRLVAGAGA